MKRPKLKYELWYSDDDGRYYEDEDDGEGCVAIKSDKVDSQKLAFLLSDQAENENYHHLVGAYEWIACMAAKYGNEEVAASMMIEIYNKGGLIQ